MRKRIWITAILSAVLVSGIFGCAAPAPTPGPTPAPQPSPAPAPPAAPIIWKWSGLVPETHSYGRSKVWWFDQISKATNGRLKIQYSPSGVLSKSGLETLTMMDKGIIEGGDVSSQHVEGQIAEAVVLSVPGLLPADMKLRQKVAAALVPDIKKMLEGKYAAYVQSFVYSTYRNLYTKAKIDKLADLQGKKIRAAGSGETAYLKALGASAANVGISETYTALQTGVIDGLGMTPEATISYKFYELAKYAVPLGYGGDAHIPMISKTAFDALPKDIQQIVVNLQPDLTAKMIEFQAADLADTDRELSKVGMQVVNWPKGDMDSLPARLTSVWQEALKTAGPAGSTLFDKIQGLVKAR